MNYQFETVGSVCSGIEAASVAWGHLGMQFQWFSEIAAFPSELLRIKYPEIPNCGDMNLLPEKIASEEIAAPDLICAGTPCQAFSLAGWKNGLNDARGNLALKLINIVEANDAVRTKAGKEKTVLFWENVEGVLSDKTNAFGSFVSRLAGFERCLEFKWSSAGIIRGPVRNIAWRILDAKYFGLPQQRRRLYLLAGGRDFCPEKILFEFHGDRIPSYPETPLVFEKENHRFQVFRAYTDCLYSSYGTKWNGNAAAYNGSLYVVQDSRIRRLSVLEAERLMGFPDHYTSVGKPAKTGQYQALGNSWAVPVIKWFGKRFNSAGEHFVPIAETENFSLMARKNILDEEGIYIDMGGDFVSMDSELINTSPAPADYKFASIHDIVAVNSDESLYISPVGCHGIIRRKNERNLKINPALEKVLLERSAQMAPEEIEKISRVQKRGRYADRIMQQTAITPELFPE